MGREFTIRYAGPGRPRRRPRRWIGKSFSQFKVLTRDAIYFMCYLPNKGFFMSGFARVMKPGHSPWKPDVRQEMPEMKKKTLTAAGGEENHRAPLETEVFRDLMPLVEHMAMVRYEDGDARDPGWISIKTTGRAWCVQVKDPDAGVSFTAVGETLDKALETAALLLGCDEAPWEHDLWLTRNAAKRKKK